MRRASLVLLLAACSSGSPTPPPGAYPGMPQMPGAPGVYPTAPMPGTPGAFGQVPPMMPGAPVGQLPPSMPVSPVVGAPPGTVLAPTASGPAPIPPGFRQITGAGFSFAVPATWIDIPPPMPQVVVAARDTTQLGQLFVNANLVTEPFPMGDGPAYVNANLAGLGQAAMILGQRPSMTGLRAGGDIEARWQNAQPVYRTLQRLTAANGTGYVLTCTADDTAFEQARATCTAILDTLRVMP